MANWSKIQKCPHAVDVDHDNMLFSTISARIATAEKKIAFDSLTPRQYKWRLTYRYLPIFVVPYADAIKDAIKENLKSEFLTSDHVFGTIKKLIDNGQYEDASFELIKYMKNVHKQGVHVKFFDLLSKTIGGLSQSEESKVCASELEAFHSSLLPTERARVEEKQVVKKEHHFVSITSLPYSPLHIEWLELKKRLRELFDKNSGDTLAIKRQKYAMNKLDDEQKELDAEQKKLNDEDSSSDEDQKMRSRSSQNTTSQKTTRQMTTAKQKTTMKQMPASQRTTASQRATARQMMKTARATVTSRLQLLLIFGVVMKLWTKLSATMSAWKT